MHIWKSFQYSVFLSHARKASVSTRSQQRNDNTDEKKDSRHWDDAPYSGRVQRENSLTGVQWVGGGGERGERGANNSRGGVSEVIEANASVVVHISSHVFGALRAFEVPP